MATDLKNLTKGTVTVIDGLTAENIQPSALTRIADASEKMAGNFTEIQNDWDWYEKWYQETCEKNAKLTRRISALQGVITKLKKRNSR